MAFPHPIWNENDPGLPAEERLDWIAVLPLGAHEQHGPHLPFETDSIIAGGIAEAAAKALPEDLPVTFLPVEAVGYSVEHMDFAGTRSLSWDEAINRWLDIAGSLSQMGVRKCVMLNAHGGNSPLMTVVATEARIRFSMLAVATSWTRFGLPDGLISKREKDIGIHAGDIETSVMLALRPDLVDIAKAEDFESYQETLQNSARHLRAYGPHAFGWKISDLNPHGATGNALAATADKGEALISHSVAGLIELLQDIHSFDISRLR
ncbi:creatininase family protein [Hoeflea prorocentri]|uniref:Creatininase family protein n=1 Tax=Hoeflea prorocentri TaxID=1922333 RepID=A0A9X3UEG1_9HYPH|nr:creatininase family protein [Hoeflea prorocentri]MCY6379195.1 creatininase family protein [Hoeflea prorocentri]MDA5396996.1 creatininase family protein [Hoeflea prorocentri]